MQPAFRSRTWKCLTVFKAQREASGPCAFKSKQVVRMMWVSSRCTGVIPTDE